VPPHVVLRSDLVVVVVAGRRQIWPSPTGTAPFAQVMAGSGLPTTESGLPLPVAELHPLVPPQRSVTDGVSGMPQPRKPSQQQVGSASGLDKGATGSILPTSGG
jgi:hypothetical protein